MTKYDAASGIGYGVLAEEAVDKSGETFDYETSKPHVQAWSEGFKKLTEGKSAGNLRAMHGNVAAGKFLAVEFDDAAKKIPVSFQVVDANEREKCAGGVYTGLSIGGQYLKRWKGTDGEDRYTAKLYEGSLVDNPCMYGATFEFVRAAGVDPEMRKFVGSKKLAKSVKQEGDEWVVYDADDKEVSRHATEDEAKAADGKKPPMDEKKKEAAARARVKKADDAPPSDAGDEILARLKELLAEAEDILGVAREDAPASGPPMERFIKDIKEQIATELVKAIEPLAQIPTTVQDGIAKTVGETVAKAVEAATGDLQKSIAGIDARVKVCEDRPAQAGTPVRRVEKAVGGPVAPDAAKPVATDLMKLINEAKASGQVSEAAVRELAIWSASRLMP